MRRTSTTRSPCAMESPAATVRRAILPPTGAVMFCSISDEDESLALNTFPAKVASDTYSWQT